MRKLSHCGAVDRRVLILYRVAPEVVSEVLPSGVCAGGGAGPRGGRDRVRPPSDGQVASAAGTSGVRAHGLPFLPGDRQSTGCCQGDAAFVTRYDCSSRLHLWIGGRLPYHHARFRVVEGSESLELVGDSDDRAMHLSLAGTGGAEHAGRLDVSHAGPGHGVPAGVCRRARPGPGRGGIGGGAGNSPPAAFSAAESRAARVQHFRGPDARVLPGWSSSTVRTGSATTSLRGPPRGPFAATWPPRKMTHSERSPACFGGAFFGHPNMVWDAQL